MHDLDEYQSAGATGLMRHFRNGRAAAQRLTDANGRVELQIAACPHAPRQRHWRQEAAAVRVPVLGNLPVRRLRQEVEPVAERWRVT